VISWQQPLSRQVGCRERAEAYFLTMLMPAVLILLLVVFSLDNADVNVVVVQGVLNLDFKKRTSGDHVELIVGQLDRGFDKLVSHLFLQDCVDNYER
jgi:hypothetical protein